MKRVIWVIFGLIVLLASAQADTRMNTSELETRGKQLRQAIDARYKELNEPGGALSSQKAMIEVVITDLFTPYIPIGMAFDDAEVVLRAAGFRVSPIQPNGNAGFIAGFDYVRDMSWFITVGFSIEADTPNGLKVAKSEGSIWKQRH